MFKINSIYLCKNISIIFAAAYMVLSCSIAQAKSSQSTSSSPHLNLKSTIAQSRCLRWDVGRFIAVQRNTAQLLHFDLSIKKAPSNDYLVGNVQYGNVFGQLINPKFINPRMNQTYLFSDSLSFIVRWNNGATGLYQGKIDSNGYLSGNTTDVNNPSSRSTWYVGKPFQCLSYGVIIRPN
jgi:hypothetical protein